MVNTYKLKSLVESNKVASLALVTSDNKPHNTPVWVNESDGKLYVFTTKTRLKTKLAQNNPYCMIAYERGSIEGKIDVIFRGTDQYKQIMDLPDLTYGDDPNYEMYKNRWNTCLMIEPTKLHLF